MQRWQCRVAPSLGALEDTADNIWHTKLYLDEFQDTVFFGLYGLPDFYTLWRHKGRKCILWAGSDINHFTNGYWLDETGSIRIDPMPLAEWIAKNCESYVENGVEHEALETLRIPSKIVPSFLGDVRNYHTSYNWDARPKVYLSVSGDNFEMYGWSLVEEIADRCQVDFHLYGNYKPWVSRHHNVFVHGRVPKEKMNRDIKEMQCGLRTLSFDGFSEILAKSALWGQHPISYIKYPHMDSFLTKEELILKLNGLNNKMLPNIALRESVIKSVNKYPWSV